MSAAGLIFMAASWGVILGLSAFCLRRLILAERDSDTRPR